MQEKIKQNSALLLIEFQEEWLSPAGKLHHLMKDKEQFKQSIEHAKTALSAARHARFPIIHSGLRFTPGYPELPPAIHGLRKEIRSHQTFLASELGSLFSPPFEPLAHEYKIRGRNGASCFTGSDLHQHLQQHGIKNIYMMGYALHVCVESTLRTAHDFGYEVIVIHNACAAFTGAQKNHVINDIVPHFGQSIDTQTFIHLLNSKEQSHANT